MVNKIDNSKNSSDSDIRDSWFQGSDGSWIRLFTENRNPLDVGRPPKSYYQTDDNSGTLYTHKPTSEYLSQFQSVTAPSPRVIKLDSPKNVLSKWSELLRENLMPLNDVNLVAQATKELFRSIFESGISCKTLKAAAPSLSSNDNSTTTIVEEEETVADKKSVNTLPTLRHEAEKKRKEPSSQSRVILVSSPEGERNERSSVVVQVAGRKKRQRTQGARRATFPVPSPPFVIEISD